MGAGVQRWWRDELPPHADGRDDSVELKFRTSFHVNKTPRWFCTNCMLISSADLHACPEPPYYVFDMTGLRYL